MKSFPAVALYALNALVSFLVAFGLNLSATQTGAIVTIATAVFAGAAALMTRPITVSAFSAAAATGLAALGAFGLNLSADKIGSAVVLLSVVLAFLTHQNVSPVGGELDK
jgi:hypothetical protein